MSDEAYYHNKGMQDGADGRYRRPHGGILDFTFASREGADRMAAENRAYDDGYYYAKGQQDEAVNRYNAPSNYEDKQAYDKGWENGRENSR